MLAARAISLKSFTFFILTKQRTAPAAAPIKIKRIPALITEKSFEIRLNPFAVCPKALNSGHKNQMAQIAIPAK